MMVGRVKMYWRLETLLNEISSNFFFYVVQDTLLMRYDEYGKIISKKVDHFATFTFSSLAEIL